MPLLTSPRPLSRALIGTSLVVSVEGSHLAHALYAMAQFGTMVTLTPPHRAYTTVADIAPFCGLHAGMFIGSYESENSFRVEIDEILAFIDEAITDKISRRGAIENFLAALHDFPVLF